MTSWKSIAINNPLDGFGSAVMTERTRPVFQEAGYYDMLSSQWNTFTTGSGTAGTFNRMMSVTTGTTANSSGTLQSKRTNIYRPGQAGVMAFTAVFTEGVASSKQIAGAIALGDGFFFGYNGTEFGVMHRYGGLAESREIEVTTGATTNSDLTLTLNSVAYTIPLTIGTTQRNAYEIASWLEANQSAWRAFQNDSSVFIIAQTDGALSGTYSYSHSDSAGTITQTRAGANKTETWTAQSSWTERTVSWLTPTNGNVYAIVYPYLGFGNVKFFVQDQDTGQYLLVHQLEYTNRNTTPSVGNPSLRAGLSAYSEGSTTDLRVSCASFQMGMQGEREFTRDLTATNNTKSLNTTETNILTIRNKYIINGYFGQAELQPVFVSYANEGTKTATFRIHKNATVGGTINFTDVNSNLSMTDVDTSGTTITNSSASTQLSFVVPPGGAGLFNLRDYDIRINPSETLTISANQNSGGAAADLSAALTWYEDY